MSGKPTIALAYPVKDAAGTVGGVLGPGINLTQLQTLFTAIPLPDGSVVTLTDAKSRVLARSLDAEQFIGKVIEEAGAQPRDVAPELNPRGPDGVRRYYGNAVVARGPWLLSVGIPTSVAIERVRASVAAQLRIRRRRDLRGAAPGALAVDADERRRQSRARERPARSPTAISRPLQPGRRPTSNSPGCKTRLRPWRRSLRDTHATLDRRIEQERSMHEAPQSPQRQVVRQERLAAVGILVSGVAHELNNPLQAILGTAELLEHDPRVSPEALEEIAFIKTQSGRAREIIRNLSRFSSQQAGPPALVDHARRDRRGGPAASPRPGSRRRSRSRSRRRPAAEVHANFTELEQVDPQFRHQRPGSRSNTTAARAAAS